jgi:hypothetical protein
MVGNLGWLDTPAPPGVLFLWSALSGGILAAALVILRGRKMLALLALFGAFVFVPALVQAAYVQSGGFIWQGRYALPLFVCAVVGCTTMLGATMPLRLDSYLHQTTIIVVVAWSATQFWTFATSVRRYAVGYDSSWSDLLTSSTWQPPWGNMWSVLVFALILIAGVATAISSVRMSSAAPDISR